MVAGVASVLAETPAERGQYLVQHVVACGNCHTKLNEDGAPIGPELGGGDPIPATGAFTAQPKNITFDPETGIGSWSDAQFAKAIRECMRPNGSVIGPPMPCDMYRHISDSDVTAIVAYIRSLPPVKNAQPKSDYKFPLPPSYGPPLGSVPDVPESDKVAYGQYLATLAHCMPCHTPTVEGSPRRDYEHALGAGGFQFEVNGAVVASTNITPDPDTGLGKWTDDEIKTAITTGVDKFGGKVLPPMPWHFFAGMHPADLDALIAYLRTLKPVVQK
jgi:mono/diheme cytochrome c family protein